MSKRLFGNDISEGKSNETTDYLVNLISGSEKFVFAEKKMQANPNENM